MISKPEILWSFLTVLLLAWFVWAFIAKDLPEDFLTKLSREREERLIAKIKTILHRLRLRKAIKKSQKK